jgi:hypothetical protein
LIGSEFLRRVGSRHCKPLDLFLRYHHEQGLSKRRFAPDELFAPESSIDYPRFG